MERVTKGQVLRPMTEDAKEEFGSEVPEPKTEDRGGSRRAGAGSSGTGMSGASRHYMGFP